MSSSNTGSEVGFAVIAGRNPQPQRGLLSPGGAAAPPVPVVVASVLGSIPKEVALRAISQSPEPEVKPAGNT